MLLQLQNHARIQVQLQLELKRYKKFRQFLMSKVGGGDPKFDLECVESGCNQYSYTILSQPEKLSVLYETANLLVLIKNKTF